MEKLYTIAVIGGTGKAGQYLVKELIRQGYKIKMLLRNPEKFKTDTPGVEIIQGDVRNYESVYSLITGCNAVVSTLGQPKGKGESLVFSVAAQNITKAMNSLNVERYVVVTGLTLDTPHDKKSLGTKLQSKIMSICFPAIIADKQKEYEIISGSNLDWTLIRLPFIELTESTGEIKISLTDCPGKKISSTDLANFLIKQLTDEQFIGKALFITN
jgi:putative NADH-flavin reductase